MSLRCVHSFCAGLSIQCEGAFRGSAEVVASAYLAVEPTKQWTSLETFVILQLCGKYVGTHDCETWRWMFETGIPQVCKQSWNKDAKELEVHVLTSLNFQSPRQLSRLFA